MFTDRNMIYADAYNVLQHKNKIGFQLPYTEDVLETLIDLSSMYRDGNTMYYNNSTLAQSINKDWTYSDYKREIIKKRYSNDDQIAIILNKDDSEEDLLRYQKMMEWREFASTLAKKIIENI